MCSVLMEFNFIVLFSSVISHLTLLTSGAGKSISTSDFGFNSKESTFVDKSLFIKELAEEFGNKIVITAPRGFGKTANLHMLKAFLQLEVDKNGNRITSITDKNKPIKDTPNYKLFSQLKVKDFPDLMTRHFGKYPVIHVDLRSIVRFLYFNETQDFFKEVMHETYSEHCYLGDSNKLFDDEKDFVRLWCSDKYVEEDMGSLMPGLEKLSKYLFKHFDRTRVVILVDHYDSPVYNCIFDSDSPGSVFNYVLNVVQMLFNIKKDDFYVDTFFITGISQIEESHFSNDKIIKRYQFLNEHKFVPFYGLLEDEVFDLLGRYTIEVDNNIFDNVQNNYGGYISICNTTVHNVWAILQYLQKQKLDHVWARGSDIPNMNHLLKIPDIRQKLELLLKGSPVVMELRWSFSSEALKILRDLLIDPHAKEHLWYTTLFYSLMFEQGFLAYDPEVKSAISNARRYVIPNEEVKQFLWTELNE
uniref:AAA-ATPase-like domain-containing protein n=1 Tax=Homalodisca liturata TaxID=320908 RepID=A0A1B6I898_9HEMI